MFAFFIPIPRKELKAIPPTPKPSANEFHRLLMKETLTLDELKLVDTHLTKHPEALYFVDGDNNNLLHLLCRYSKDSRLFESIYSHLKRRNKTDLLFSVNRKHEFPLHFAAAYSSADFVTALIRLMPLKKTLFIIKSVSDYNKNVLEYGNLNMQHAKEMTELLAPIAGFTDLPSVTHVATIGKETKEIKENPIIQTNIALGESIVNELRTFITGSMSHPTNNIDGNFTKLLDDLKKLRKDTNYKKDVPITKEYCQKVYEACKKHKFANCGEYAEAAMHLLTQKSSTTFGEIFKITNGDHSFLVIGRDPYSDPTNWETWGPNAVVCDPWAGKVYPAKDIPKMLNYYHFHENRFTKKRFVITGPFRPDFHKLKRLYSTQIVSTPGRYRRPLVSR